ncbi:MAG: tripartite tricarboxylate transporter substrate-binding protein [Lentisphaeraceae bacterium]|nr:tripartite tricarboxylate transporter substrate-binding protein [Lentisphaeraceae bacterium]
MKYTWHIGVIVFVAFSVYGSFMASKNREGVYPERPIKVIVPYNPGGGTDTFVRIINKAIQDEKLLPQPIVVVNKPGGATTIGSSFVRYARPDGYTILCLHEALMTTYATGQSPHSPDAFEPISATGEDGQMILVSKNSKYKTMKDFMDAAEQNPNTVKFGVSLNAPPHFSGIMLEKINGAKFRFVPTGGAAKRLSSLVGGHIDAAIFTVSEYVRFKESGLEALAYLSDERHPTVDYVPTGKELGYPVENSNLQYWWFPKGTDPQIIELFAGVLRKAMEADYVRKRLGELQIIPKVIEGEALKTRIQKKMASFKSMEIERRVEVPNLTNWTIGFIIFFGIIVLVKSFKKEESEMEEDDGLKLRNDLAAGTVILTLIYVLVLSFHLMEFRLATALFVLAAGSFLTGFYKKKLIYVGELSLVMSLGLYFVFTELFLIYLP